MRDFILAANWKLNKTPSEASQFFRDFSEKLEDRLSLPPTAGGESRDIRGFGEGPNGGRRRIVFFVPALLVATSEQVVKGTGLEIGGQNIWVETKGAFTGENSSDVLNAMGAAWALVGHSERRSIFGETDKHTAQKMKTALTSGLSAMLCVGETLAEREAGETLKVVFRQLEEGLSLIGDVIAKDPSRVAIAYEPVWAIGTGKVATPEQASEVHQALRKRLAEFLGKSQAGAGGADSGTTVASEIALLYGGSVKPDNAKALGSKPDIDGFLVGGASLEPDSFLGLF